MSSKLIIINAKKELGGCKTYEYRKYSNVDGTITYVDCDGLQRSVTTSSNAPMALNESLVGYFCAKEILSFNYRQELGSRPVQPRIIDENGCNIPSDDGGDDVTVTPVEQVHGVGVGYVLSYRTRVDNEVECHGSVSFREIVDLVGVNNGYVKLISHDADRLGGVINTFVSYDRLLSPSNDGHPHYMVPVKAFDCADTPNQYLLDQHVEETVTFAHSLDGVSTARVYKVKIKVSGFRNAVLEGGGFGNYTP